MHARAVAQLDSRLYNDAPALETAALPDAFNPFRWSGVVETAVDYRLLAIDTRAQLDLDDLHHRYFKPALTPAITSAKATEPFRFFVYFARFPVWSESPVRIDERSCTRVELADLRFGAPGTGAFHAIALEDSGQRVLRSWFTYGSGTDLGWGDTGAPPGAGR
ncbi:MAG: hypothetical protein JOZ62_00895 [Acidobacteriaceae bacterium]|nr:hypothetical protein [Acidobacteriaceae bacterium]